MRVNQAADPMIAGLNEGDDEYTVIVENELFVRSPLPNATHDVYRQLAQSW